MSNAQLQLLIMRHIQKNIVSDKAKEYDIDIFSSAVLTITY